MVCCAPWPVMGWSAFVAGGGGHHLCSSVPHAFRLRAFGREMRFPGMISFHRLLLYRIADRFMLGHETIMSRDDWNVRGPPFVPVLSWRSFCCSPFFPHVRLASPPCLTLLLCKCDAYVSCVTKKNSVTTG